VPDLQALVHRSARDEVLAVAEHCPQDIDSATRPGDDGLMIERGELRMTCNVSRASSLMSREQLLNIGFCNATASRVEQSVADVRLEGAMTSSLGRLENSSYRYRSSL